MLATDSNGKPTLAINGINQQDFTEIQLAKGSYPYQKGLQKRLPGKTLEQQFSSSVGSIYVFYLVFGRHYNLIDVSGTLTFVPVPVAPITVPALPPTGNTWFDDFSGYTPDGLISFLWGGGAWATTTGICQSIIDGIIDPFLVYATIPGTSPIVLGSSIPSVVPTPDPSPETTPADPGSPGYLYPPGHLPQIITENQPGTLWPSESSEELPQNVSIPDVVNYEDYPGAGVTDTLVATSITIGSIVNFHGVTVGRRSDVPFGDATAPTPPGPSIDHPALPPNPINYYVYMDGNFGTTP